MPLEKELEFFKQKREEWLPHYEGKFILVVGQEFIGAFDDARSAYEAGIDRFGNIPILVKHLKRGDEEPASFPSLTLGLIDAHT